MPPGAHGQRDAEEVARRRGGKETRSFSPGGRHEMFRDVGVAEVGQGGITGTGVREADPILSDGLPMAS